MHPPRLRPGSPAILKECNGPFTSVILRVGELQRRIRLVP
jgi:hypothetical protein